MKFNTLKALSSRLTKFVKIGCRGVSLPEVLITASVLAGIAVTVVHLTKNQEDSFHRAKGKQDELILLSTIRDVLNDPAACANTLTLTGTVIANNATISGIRDSANNVVVEEGGTYGNRSLSLAAIRLLVNIGNFNNVSGSTNKFGEVGLQFQLSRLKGSSSARSFFRTVNTSIEIDISNRFVSCHTGVVNAITSAKAELCDSLGGVLSGDHCTLKNDVINVRLKAGRVTIATNWYAFPRIEVHCPIGYAVASCSAFASDGSWAGQSSNADAYAKPDASGGNPTVCYKPHQLPHAVDSFTYHENVTEFTVEAKCLSFLGRKCLGGRFWNGTACICASPRTIEGDACVCPGGQVWHKNLVRCICPTGLSLVSGQCKCPSGKIWDGDVCITPASTVTSCSTTTINNCRIQTGNHGDTKGDCATGYVGTCSYRCSGGNWLEVTPLNTCQLGNSCPVTLIGTCSLNAGSHDQEDGNCASGYSGSCRHKCNNGAWEPTAINNSCMQDCAAMTTSDGKCILPTGQHNQFLGECYASQYSGTCLHRCDNGTWQGSTVNCRSRCPSTQRSDGGGTDSCSLDSTDHGQTSGSCPNNGNCEYRCNDGNWNYVSGSCN